ncbi:hypothetical protein [Sphingomonas montanisoli]|uniref:Uncharacterized protein n=1 Tax=Sphingomonas montanisoli TaxID=2606412 RepID=A0A5D9CBX9_9SPHN|nr:hypothetical protein [Sphingomonas montanisoli]TZG28817.1 hypothetical protein FYJ91_01335 [Sphingomonas montanisoli]
MLHPTVRRYATPTLFALGAILMGVVGGTTTVSGMSVQRYGSQAVAAGLEHNPYAPGTGDYGDDYYQPAAYDEGCGGCSERDLGYRWAGRRNLGSPDDCPTDSWGFNRGCIAYFRDVSGA